MVYCGKPSRGCQMCRTRRIKCDETKPTCNQCAKSRRQCPGYKDEFDLVFRNETQATERRARKASKKAMALKIERHDGTSDGSDSSSGSHSPPNFGYTIETPLLASLKVPTDEQATCHFLSNYVLMPRSTSKRGFLEFVLPYIKIDNPPEHFKSAFDACSFAYLGNKVGTGNNFESQALGSYSRALSTTFAALRDPEMAKHDATLAAVLLLGLFENITAKNMGTLAWGSHIEGAIQLVRSRGRKQLRTKTGLSLFIAVRTQMIIQMFTSGKPLAMDVDWWVNDEATREEHASSCQRLNIRAGELRAEINKLMMTLPRTPKNIEIIMELLKRCQMLDQDCVRWTQTLPPHFEMKTVAWIDQVPGGDYSKAEVFPGRVDVYQDMWVASVWNMLRVSRLILASMSVRCAAWVCAPVDYRTTPEYATAARCCVDMITDIIASVPHQLGWFSNHQDLLGRADLSSFACGENDGRKGLCGYFLTWPLTTALSQDYATDVQRCWIRGRLDFISSQLGIRYASILSQLNIRIPSMLIRRDGLMAAPNPSAYNFEKMLSRKILPPTMMAAKAPHEAMQKEFANYQVKDLIDRSVDAPGQVDDATARAWLNFQHASTPTV